MIGLLLTIAVIAAMFVLAIRREALWTWAVLLAVATLFIKLGLFAGELHLPSFRAWALAGWLPAIILGLLSWRPARRVLLTRPVFGLVKRVLPPVSKTEQEAIDAGTLGFDAELFSGRPDWEKLRAVPPVVLTEEEQRFIDNEAEQLCQMLDDWEIRHNQNDVPEHIWNFVREKGFLGMLISKEHGGLGFSAQAQSIILGKVSSRNPDASIVVMVPNSLGPGELIEKFGTDAQKQQYLEPLAKGRENPLLRADQPLRRLRRRQHARRGLCREGHAQRPGGHRHPRKLGQALYHAGAQGHAAGPRLPSARPAELSWARAATPASRWR